MKLNHEEIAARYYGAALASCYRTEPADRPLVERLVREVSGESSLPVVWEWSPPKEYPAYWLQSESDRSWVTYYMAAREYPDITDASEEIAQAEKNYALLDACYMVCWYADRIVCVESPDIYSVDEQGNYHSRDGLPALHFRDGTCFYAWHGIVIPGAYVRGEKKITTKIIAAERNQERRRALIGLYGEARWLSDTGATPIDTNDDLHANLYRIDDGELILLCSDGVPQLDGSAPSYSLRVNRELRPMRERPDGSIEYGQPQKLTALNAVASTYGLRGEDYGRPIRT